MPMPRTAVCLLFVGLALVYAVLPGCNVVGAATTMFAPPELVDAMYELPDKPTLIIVDDPGGLVNNQGTLRQIALATQAALEEEQVVTTGFITQAQLTAYREELGPAYPQTTLAGLGLHLGARQVIHADVSAYQMDLGGNVVRPSITLNVRVFDLDERVRAFPPMSGHIETGGSGAPYYQLRSQLPARDLTGLSAARSLAVRDLANQAGRDVGRLFFDWRKPQPGADLGNR